jgi:hypothetical protein
MATRRRRTTQPKPEQPAIENTHEEMLEEAAKRETEFEVEEENEEEEALEVFLAASLADTFEAIQKAEEKVEIESAPESEIRYPAPTADFIPVAPTPLPKRRPRYILRENTRRRKG